MVEYEAVGSAVGTRPNSRSILEIEIEPRDGEGGGWS